MQNYNPGWKFNHWEQKGVPLRIEFGQKDMSAGEVKVVRRDTSEKWQAKLDDVAAGVPALLEQIYSDMYNRAKAERDSRIFDATTWEEFMKQLNKKNLILAPWCEAIECEEKVKARSKEESLALENEGEEVLTGSAKTLCLPLEQKPLENGQKCFACDANATKRALWGRSY